MFVRPIVFYSSFLWVNSTAFNPLTMALVVFARYGLDRSIDELHSQEKEHFGEKSTANFAVYLLLFEDKICSFPKNCQNSMQKKEDKVGSKTPYKEERQGKKENDRNRFACAKNKKDV